MHKFTIVAILIITTVIIATVQCANVETEKPQDGNLLSGNSKQDVEQPGVPHVRLSCYRRCLRECRGKKNRGCKGNKCICVN